MKAIDLLQIHRVRYPGCLACTECGRLTGWMTLKGERMAPELAPEKVKRIERRRLFPAVTLPEHQREPVA